MSDELHDMLSSLLEAAGLELYDVQVRPGLVRVTVDRDGGVDVDSLAEAHRRIAAGLHEMRVPAGDYALEVTSPGVERPLSSRVHFERAVGEAVTLRTTLATGEVRRVSGLLAAADAESIVISGSDVPEGAMRLRYEDVDRARTVLEWGPTPPPRGGGHREKKRGKDRQRHATSDKLTKNAEAKTERATTR
jgi:ribosome maturation factor RimP